jgi:hypothetical protein
MPGSGVSVGGATAVSVGKMTGVGLSGGGATVGDSWGMGVNAAVGVMEGVRVAVRVVVTVLVAPGVTVGGPTTAVRVSNAVADAKGVIVIVRVPVGRGVPAGVDVRVGVREARGVRVRVGILVGGRRVGTRVGATPIVASGVPSSAGGSGWPGVPGTITVAVGRPSTTSPLGRRSQADATNRHNTEQNIRPRARARGRVDTRTGWRCIDSLYHTRR